MDKVLEELKKEFPNSFSDYRIQLNSNGTSSLPGHRGVGTAISFKGDESVMPRVLMPHRLFTHVLGVRLDIPEEERPRVFANVKEQLAKIVPREILGEDSKQGPTSLRQLVEDYGEEMGNDAHYTHLLPYESCISLMRANETADDDVQYYFVIKTHSGLAGRQLVRTLWPSMDTRVTVSKIRSSKEYRAVETYAYWEARCLLMTYLSGLDLLNYVADLPTASNADSRNSQMMVREPHFDMVTNCFRENTLLNECYHIKSTLGPNLLFFTDTLHNALLFQRPSASKDKDSYMPAHGDFFTDGAELKITDKHQRRMKNGEWTFCKDYPFATPKLHQHHYGTSSAAITQLRSNVADDAVFEGKRVIVPVYQVCH